MAESIIIVETPRDAFQGLSGFIPTDEKIRYIRALIQAGYRHIDLGSFVPAKNVPQMADSEEIVEAFKNDHAIERIAIVVNLQGVTRAINVGGLDALGFPFSLSSRFQMQNTRKSTRHSWPLIERMIESTEQNDMSFILYLSMAFGNPYDEPWNEEELFALIRRLALMGVRHISLADTVAVAQPAQVEHVFSRAQAEYPQIEFSAHFHGRPENWFDCVQAALKAGCRRFDAAGGGLGGCPFATDKLIANIPSDELAARLSELGFETGVDLLQAKRCAAVAREFQQRYG
ncbi:MAG TPA: hydroxymethylglutaryl-CoA lyase [Planctomycetota bacterium]|jgi:hydroxymethylglutaryl-CoA lyase